MSQDEANLPPETLEKLERIRDLARKRRREYALQKESERAKLTNQESKPAANPQNQ